jgi:hypothetical protein
VRRRAGRFRAQLRTLALTCGAVAVGAICAPGTAVAGAPQRLPIDITDSGSITATCGFPVAYTFHQFGAASSVVDNTVSQPSALVRLHTDLTLSANGITLIEREVFTLIVSQDGIVRNAGLPTHIQGLGGVVLLDAGELVLLPSDDPNAPPMVVAVHGPHPQFFGPTFCAALTP